MLIKCNDFVYETAVKKLFIFAFIARLKMSGLVETSSFNLQMKTSIQQMRED